MTALLVALLSGERLPAGADVARLWWGWIGGILGTIYVVSMLLAAGRLGSALFTGLTVTTAVLASLAMDHWALLGFERHPAGPGRIAGGVPMIAGLALIARF